MFLTPVDLLFTGVKAKQTPYPTPRVTTSDVVPAPGFRRACGDYPGSERLTRLSIRKRLVAMRTAIILDPAFQLFSRN